MSSLWINLSLFLACVARIADTGRSPTVLHTIVQDERGVRNFRKAASPRRLGSPGDLAPDDDAAQASGDDVDPAWASVITSASSDGAQSLGAKVTDDGRIELVPLAGGLEGSDDYMAKGSFRDSMDQLGWGSLLMQTSPSEDVDDGLKMYAAGAVEGFLTARRMQEFHHNSRALLLMNSANKQRLPKLKAALRDTIRSLARVADEDSSDASSLDGQARLALLQTWGVRDGYALASDENKASLSMPDMFILNSDGVIDELMTALGGEAEDAEALVQRGSRRQQLRGVSRSSSNSSHPGARKGAGHCTGVVRLADGNSELYFGHTTWESFSEMTRIWKVYDFPLKGAATKKISFSSYPGCISSTDDYYLMDNGLAITETTLSIPRQQKYSPSQSMPDFVRIMAANRLSSSAEEWVRSMADSATGTYSSQWMVLDYKKFKQGEELPDGAFYVLEQAPATSHYEDMSGWLREKKYWASYDRAFFDDVRATTGDDAMLAREGRRPEAELFSKDHTPRAQIVSQTENSINSLAAMRDEMTRNKGSNEPVDQPALQVPSYTISARSDLADGDRINKDGSPDGGVDAKITSSCLFRTLTAQAISSPSHAERPPFRWTSPQDGSELWPGYPHEGLPDEANFDWVRVDPQDQMLNSLDSGTCQ